MVFLHNGTIETDLLNLQTNTNTYLVNHCHPRHTKKAIPFSLGAANISRTEALHIPNRHDSIDRLPFVVSFNPSLPHISNIPLRKHFHILLSSKRGRTLQGSF